MPSHIFTRLGYWQESIDTNLASANTAKAGLPESDRQIISTGSVLHPIDYIMYGYLQWGQDGPAKALLDEINTIEIVPVGGSCHTDLTSADVWLGKVPTGQSLPRLCSRFERRSCRRFPPPMS